MSPKPSILQGANLTYAESQLGSYLTEKIQNLTLTTTAQQIFQNNADRLEVAMFNLGSNDAVGNFDPNVSSTYGFKIVASSGFLILKLKDDFTLLTRPFFALATASTTNLTVVELIRIVHVPGGTP